MSTDIQTDVCNAVYDAINPLVELKESARGKTILITGAGRGIGQAIAQAFAQASAAALVLTALEDDELAETARLVRAEQPTCRVLCRGLDVRDGAAVEAFVAEAAAWAGGRVDVLCCNAGVSPALQELATGDAAGWWTGIEVNVKGTYLFARHVLPRMRAQGGGGRIIVTASRAATLVEPLMSSYQVAKLALARLVDCIDVENAAHGIRAFAIHPGGIVTRLLTDMEAAADGTGALASAFIRPRLNDHISLPGAVCVWLASGRADFLGGRYVDCTTDVRDLCRHEATIVDKDLFKAAIAGNWDASGGVVNLPRQ